MARYSSIVSLLVWALSALMMQATFAAAAKEFRIVPRQSSTTVVVGGSGAGTGNTVLSAASLGACVTYSSVANYSTIGANSTLRAAFLQLSPHGTLLSASILDNAIAALPQYEFDATLNADCGNLTTIALDAANTNFSMGIVADFKVSAAARQLTLSSLSSGAMAALVVFSVGALVL
ncbi:hypothetical protein BX600DRAFT_109807 [Xylariales sp. PMI_506]|nr:hypothetical protein BX600DRAFT_109807 [Xylariales sp. PMI_506]